MSADTPTPLDLDALRALVADLDAAFDAPDDGRTLVTEHPTLTLLAHVAAQVPTLLAEVERLRAEVARLEEDLSDRTMDLAELTHPDLPDPAWDEDAAAAAVLERSHEPPFEDSEEGMQEAKRFVRSLAVVREQPSVKPSRETIARAILNRYSSFDLFSAYGIADAVLDLWPGRSEAMVKRETWDEGAKAAWESSGEGWNGEYPPGTKHDVRNPYREGGAS